MSWGVTVPRESTCASVTARLLEWTAFSCVGNRLLVRDQDRPNHVVSWWIAVTRPGPAFALVQRVAALAGAAISFFIHVVEVQAVEEVNITTFVLRAEG